MYLFGMTAENSFYIIGSVYMSVMLLVLIAAVIAAIVVKRKVNKKIREIKAIPLRGKVFTTTFLKALFR